MGHASDQRGYCNFRALERQSTRLLTSLFPNPVKPQMPSVSVAKVIKNQQATRRVFPRRPFLFSPALAALRPEPAFVLQRALWPAATSSQRGGRRTKGPPAQSSAGPGGKSRPQLPDAGRLRWGGEAHDSFAVLRGTGARAFSRFAKAFLGRSGGDRSPRSLAGRSGAQEPPAGKREQGSQAAPAQGPARAAGTHVVSPARRGSAGRRSGALTRELAAPQPPQSFGWTEIPARLQKERRARAERDCQRLPCWVVERAPCAWVAHRPRPARKGRRLFPAGRETRLPRTAPPPGSSAARAVLPSHSPSHTAFPRAEESSVTS